MSARAWVNLGLVALLAGLALMAWLRPGQSPPGEIGLITLGADKISRINIKRAAQPAIEFERRDGQWWLTSPIKMPANEIRIDAFLNLAAQTSDTKYNAIKLDLAQYGLASPKVSVTLNDQPIALGNINPVNYRRYALVGDTVYLINDDLFDLESADAASYVDLRLLPKEADIAALVLPQVTLEREKGDSWRQNPPETLTEADIKALLTAWRDAQALRVSAYGGKPSQAQARVKLTGGRQMLFKVIAREPELILARPKLGIQYHLLANAARSLLHPETPTDVTGGETTGSR
jgi:hypothetical protein